MIKKHIINRDMSMSYNNYNNKSHRNYIISTTSNCDTSGGTGQTINPNKYYNFNKYRRKKYHRFPFNDHVRMRSQGVEHGATSLHEIPSQLRRNSWEKSEGSLLDKESSESRSHNILTDQEEKTSENGGTSPFLSRSTNELSNSGSDKYHAISRIRNLSECKEYSFTPLIYSVSQPSKNNQRVKEKYPEDDDPNYQDNDIELVSAENSKVNIRISKHEDDNQIREDQNNDNKYSVAQPRKSSSDYSPERTCSEKDYYCSSRSLHKFNYNHKNVCGQQRRKKETTLENDKKPYRENQSINKFSRINHRIDSNKIRNTDPICQPVYNKYIHEIDVESIKPDRGGVIVYTTINGNLFFGLGIDSRSGDLTDFGGGINYKHDKNAINGSLREFMEESLSVFGAYSYHDVKKCLAVYSETIMIIFLHLEVDVVSITNTFNQRVKLLKNPEVSHIFWLNKDEFKRAILNGNILGKNLYIRVAKLLSQSNNFYKYL